MITLDDLSNEQLKELVRVYARNFLAIDGVWFQSVEQKWGMDEAMHHDCEAWKRYSVSEARRLKKFLQLDEHPGLEGLQQAFVFRFSAFVNSQVECFFEEQSLIFRVVDCQVQSTRKRKGMPLHPCLEIGRIEYPYFARTIDERIGCEVLSCHPQITDPGCACAWRFYIEQK